jgi:outer membrane receptor protein involved in Fe transport
MLDVALRIPLISAVSMKLDAKNLLDARFEVTQGGVVRHRYHSGRTYGIGFSWSPLR